VGALLSVSGKSARTQKSEKLQKSDKSEKPCLWVLSLGPTLEPCPYARLFGLVSLKNGGGTTFHNILVS